MTVELSRADARRLVLSSQLLDAERPASVVEVAAQLGAIKIDPTATIAPAEHAICWARIGWSYEPAQLQAAFAVDRMVFEFDGAFVPIDALDAMRPAMRAFPTRPSTRTWWDANRSFRSDVLDALSARGPLPSSAIEDTAQVAMQSDGWYGRSQVPLMLECLMRAGEVAIAERRGRTRVWDLAERVYPPVARELDDESAQREREERRLRGAGLGKQRSSLAGVGTAGEAARVEGSAWTWRVDPDALAALDHPVPGRVALLNPYDPMLFDRGRLRELFDFDYVLEQFKPKSSRRFGYFAYPVLIDDRFKGMLDAHVVKDRPELHVTALHEVEPFVGDDMDRVRAEIDDLAGWLGVEVTGN